MQQNPLYQSAVKRRPIHPASIAEVLFSKRPESACGSFAEARAARRTGAPIQRCFSFSTVPVAERFCQWGASAGSIAAIQYIICARLSSLKKRYAGAEYEKAVAAEHAKASIRCKAEHVFAVVKGMFRFRKTRLRGLTKVNAQLHMLFALANLILAARPSLAV